MLELISIPGRPLIVCILIPIKITIVRNGWVRKQFAGDRPKFLAAYRKQLRMLTWLGLVFGVLGIGLAAIEANHGEAIVKLVAAVIWFAVSGISPLSELRQPGKGARHGPGRPPRMTDDDGTSCRCSSAWPGRSLSSD